MKAYVRVAAQDGAVELVEVATPTAEAEQVVVAMRAFGVGVHDRYFLPPDPSFPYTIGIEGAGVVDAVGPQAEGVEVGDRVMVLTVGHRKGAASAEFLAEGRTWAEFVAVDRAGVTAIPDGLDFATAAGVPVAGGTAVECLHTLALNSGETLYVAGASGAIGTLVVQMATQRGVRVAASASAPNHEYLYSLGVKLAVDYRDPGWSDEVRRWAPGGVDAALAIQPGTAPSSQRVVRDGGHVVTVSGDPCAAERGIRMEQFPHRADPGREMAQLVDDIVAGRVRLVLEQVYPFDRAVDALEKTETRHARGKLVVTVP
jgi:NADPH:quinone reductase-like Zn-dependent oxidoreductase